MDDAPAGEEGTAEVAADAEAEADDPERPADPTEADDPAGTTEPPPDAEVGVGSGPDAGDGPAEPDGVDEFDDAPDLADRPPPDPAELDRLDPRVRLVWGLRAVILAALASVPAVGARLLLDAPAPILGILVAAVLLLGLGHAVLRYRRWGYAVREDALYLERGVVTEVRTVVPLVRIQHVDSRRGPVERAVGLASCVVYTAGSRGADVRIPGLTPAGATDLREELKRLAIRAEGADAV
jgi:membrane protein YdbS with pleckstrin-like domain